MSSARRSTRRRASRRRRAARADRASEIDAATRANLELTRTLSGERAGSLLATIDMTKTPAGARLIAERLASPLTDPAEIAERLDAVGFFVEAPALRDELARDASPRRRISCARWRGSALDRGGPRDLAALRDGLIAERGRRGAARSGGEMRRRR